MTTIGDELAAFDADVLAAAADERGVEEGTLADAVRRHQESVASLPGVEDLVYEWRKHYDDPVVERTADVYCLTVPDWVWNEFGESLDVDDVVLDALVAVHARTVAERTDAGLPAPDGRAYVVLDRRFDREDTDR